MTEITFDCSEININYIDHLELKKIYRFLYDENKTISDYLNELKDIYEKKFTPKDTPTTGFKSDFLNYGVYNSEHKVVPRDIQLKKFKKKNYNFRISFFSSTHNLFDIIKNEIRYLLSIDSNSLIQFNNDKKLINEYFNYLD